MHQARGRRQEPGVAHPPRLQESDLAPAKKHHLPRNDAEDHESEPEMHGEPVGSDVQDVAGKTGRNHPPPDRALNAAKDAEQQQAPRPAGRNAARGKKEKESGGPDEARDATKLPMPPLPPVNGPEFGKGHAFVLKPVFGKLPVLLEFRLPRFGAHGRKGTGDRLPFRDREPAVGQPRQPARDDHQHNQNAKRRQPDANGAPGSLPGTVYDTACGCGGPFRAFADLLEDVAFPAHPKPLASREM